MTRPNTRLDLLTKAPNPGVLADAAIFLVSGVCHASNSSSPATPSTKMDILTFRLVCKLNTNNVRLLLTSGCKDEFALNEFFATIIRRSHFNSRFAPQLHGEVGKLDRTT